MEHRVLSREEFGAFLVDQIDDLVDQLYPNLRRGVIDLAIPLRVSVRDGQKCTCKRVCTEMPDGGTECACVCTGDCTGDEAC